uniref:Uncharacterized protein n=1 Tax=Anguilla anguilla TaxID=7936 RepID=A0A0E9X9Y6_ANGAN
MVHRFIKVTTGLLSGKKSGNALRQNKILTSVQKYKMPLCSVVLVFHSPTQSASQ